MWQQRGSRLTTPLLSPVQEYDEPWLEPFSLADEHGVWMDAVHQRHAERIPSVSDLTFLTASSLRYGGSEDLEHPSSISISGSTIELERNWRRWAHAQSIAEEEEERMSYDVESGKYNDDDDGVRANSFVRSSVYEQPEERHAGSVTEAVPGFELETDELLHVHPLDRPYTPYPHHDSVTIRRRRPLPSRQNVDADLQSLQHPRRQSISMSIQTMGAPQARIRSEPNLYRPHRDGWTIFDQRRTYSGLGYVAVGRAPGSVDRGGAK